MGLHIQIAGGIATGKTTLCKRLAKNHVHGIYEDFQAVPFWKAFYASPGAHAFETEISFLLQHYHQAKCALQLAPVTVCDYSFLMDYAYAMMGLKGLQFDAFLRVYDAIIHELGPPSRLVYLRCSEETALERIRTRGREVEQNLDLGFLRGLNQTLEACLRDYRHSELITVSTDEVDLLAEGPLQAQVMERILQIG